MQELQGKLYEHVKKTRHTHFECSYSNYAMNETDEAILIEDAIEEYLGENNINDEFPEYNTYLTHILVQMCMLYGATREERENCGSFLAAVFNELTRCNQREENCLSAEERDE